MCSPAPWSAGWRSSGRSSSSSTRWQRFRGASLLVECGPLRPGELVVALEEGWRGEIAHVVLTDDTGRIRRYKVVDPSFHNWSAVAAAMPGNQISDFPLCNKSFNLSYAGHDL